MSGSRYTHSFSHHDNTSVPIVQAERYTNLPTDPQLASGSIKMKTRDLVNPSSHLVNVVTIHLGTLAGTFRISPFLLSLITTTKRAKSPEWLLFLIPLHSHILTLAQVQIGFFFFSFGFLLRWNLHKIQLAIFKVYSSVAFSTFTVLYNHYLDLVLKQFYHPKRKISSTTK